MNIENRMYGQYQTTEELAKRARREEKDTERKAKKEAKVKAAARRVARNAYNREYATRRYVSDPQFKLRRLLRTRLKRALMSQHITTSFQSHAKFLGCSVEHALQHIEKQFEPWMSWENHGTKGWHIDHIKPLSAFDLTDPVQVAEACHYTNLRPLHWQENLTKGGVKTRFALGLTV